MILRTSDFKTNEYRDMKGGEKYRAQGTEPHDRLEGLLPLRFRLATARRSSWN